MSDDKPAWHLIATVGAATSVAGLAVILRLWTRFAIVRNPGWEDLFIAFAIVCSILTGSFMILEVKHGMGKHMLNMSTEELKYAMMYLYASIVPYFMTLTMVKISVLMQYLRLFTERWFRICCYALLAFIICFAIAHAASNLLICSPVAYFWDPSIVGGSCVSKLALWFTSAGISITTDFIIVALPTPVIYRLHMPRQQKIALVGVFALGGLACVMAILRLKSLLKISRSEDPTYDNPAAAIWSCIEANVAVLAASIPSLKALISRCVPHFLDNSRGLGSGERWNKRHALGLDDRSQNHSSRCIERGISVEQCYTPPVAQEKFGTFNTITSDAKKDTKWYGT